MTRLVLFAAIRRRNPDVVARLLRADPDLVRATEAWSWDEAIRAGLRNAENGTPLIRAAETGDLEIVELLLAAGARVDARCACAGAETPLWTAVLHGHDEIVERLLGADPNAAAFAGATPLHPAVRAQPQLVSRLLAAGADPSRTDKRGRAPADWAQIDGRRPATLPSAGSARQDVQRHPGLQRYPRQPVASSAARALAARVSRSRPPITAGMITQPAWATAPTLPDIPICE